MGKSSPRKRHDFRARNNIFATAFFRLLLKQSTPLLFFTRANSPHQSTAVKCFTLYVSTSECPHPQSLSLYFLQHRLKQRRRNRSEKNKKEKIEWKRNWSKNGENEIPSPSLRRSKRRAAAGSKTALGAGAHSRWQHQRPRGGGRRERGKWPGRFAPSK